MPLGKLQLYKAGTATPTNKAIMKAKFKATKYVDKIQNVALQKLSRKVNILAKLPEIKNYSANSGTLSIPSTGLWYADLTKDITTGVTDNTRIGDAIKALSIHIKGSLNMPVLAGTAFVRIILVRYKESYYNSAPNIANLLNTTDYRSFYNSETVKDQFSILYDKTFNMINQPSDKCQYQIKIHKKLNNAHVAWDSGQIQNSPTNGHLFLYAISDQTALYPFINFTSLFYYRDM